MRKTLFAFAILASALSITLTAHADTIDDFVLTGNGETVTFSLPATGVYTLHQHFDSFSASGPGTIDGAPATVGATFYVPYFEIVQSAPDLTIDSNPQSNIPDLYGSIPYSWFVVPAEFPNPEDEGTFNVTFVPGTYQLQTGNTFFDHPFTPPLPFTLSITPETPIAPTPEPASLILLATGALGAITTLKRRKSMAP
ncbi:PEP-CTERM sorting domain-containing protein [Tunturibacter psychrotolerans]|uniref:PEP-CTERM sorting domain-containing protein n=1 Tax=Tunturiibacter psychrotolerans TaxID=3069686 RepID=A0AAU7ZQ66_9BACT